MLAGGLWHGAAWTFVGWGGAHGAAQVAQQEFKRQLPPTPEHEPWRKLLSWFLTLNFVCMCCILFRSQTFRVAWLMVKRYVGLGAAGVHTLPLWMAVLGPALLLGQWAMRRAEIGERVCCLSLGRFALVYGVVWAAAISMLPLGYRPFIYFQF